MEEAVNTGLTNTWAYVGKEDAEMMNMDGIGLSLSLSHCYTSYENYAMKAQWTAWLIGLKSSNGLFMDPIW